MSFEFKKIIAKKCHHCHPNRASCIWVCLKTCHIKTHSYRVSSGPQKTEPLRMWWLILSHTKMCHCSQMSWAYLLGCCWYPCSWWLRASIKQQKQSQMITIHACWQLCSEWNQKATCLKDTDVRFHVFGCCVLISNEQMTSDLQDMVTKKTSFSAMYFGVAVLRGAASAALVPQAGLSSYAILGSCNPSSLGVQRRRVNQLI